MARRDDGNEPIPTRPLRTAESTLREIQDYGESPADQCQEDLVPPIPLPGEGPDTPGLPEIPVPGIPAVPGAGNQYQWDDAWPDICRFGIQPQMLNGLLIRFLQGHFARPENIYTPDIRQYTWAPNTTSKILITTNTGNNLAQANQVPRLIVKRGRQETSRLGIGDRSGQDAQQIRQGTSTYSRITQGTSTIFAVGETDGQTELLAQEVFKAFTWAGPIIMKRLPFHDFQTISLGESMIMSSVADKFGIPIELRYAYEYSWRNTEHAPALSALSFVINTRT